MLRDKLIKKLKTCLGVFVSIQYDGDWGYVEVDRDTMLKEIEAMTNVERFNVTDVSGRGTFLWFEHK